MFSLISIYVPFILCITLIHAYVNDTYWLIIQNDHNSISNFHPAIFHKHPRRYGQKLNFTYPALYLQDKKLIFGQTDDNQNSNYCASFNVDSDFENICTNFRILKKLSEDSNYYLIKPELFDPFLDDPVGFDDKFLVIVYDYYSDSSFFGTLHRPIDDEIEPVVYAVDYDNAPVEIRGVKATSNGDFIMYVVRQRPFFHPFFHGLCRPINDQDEERTENQQQNIQNEQLDILASVNEIEKQETDEENVDNWFFA